MILEEAINILRCKTDGNATEALEVVIRTAEKSIKYRKEAKRFKRKWLDLKCELREIRKEIAQLQNPIPANYFKGEYISRDTVLEIIDRYLND